ncbi:MAG TPA: uracil-DNA glycosylase [Clostridiales bacterium]|nr:uracil-DNA glycosylase [Clostridiales bacterium]
MLEALYDRMEKFYDGELVLGEGPKNAAILLIGEAPGKDEVREKRPFCGKAGKNLDAFLQAIHMERQDIYITNVCKFRPFKVSEKGTVSNRPPKKCEVRQALPFLYEEIGLIAPRLIVTLGNTPLRACCGAFEKNIGEMHGRVVNVAIAEREYPLFALYHPASVIYNRSLNAVYEDDLRQLAQYVAGMGNGNHPPRNGHRL